MAFAIPIPDWNSLDSVRHAHSELEAIALVCFALLVLFDVLAHLSKKDEKRETLLEKISLGFFAVAVLAEIAAYPYGQRNDTLSEQVIVSLDAKARAAANNASTSLSNSKEAETKSSDAVDKAGKALDKSKAANDAVGKAQEKVGGVAKRAEDIEANLTNFALCNAPRVISPWFIGNAQSAKSYVAPLRPMAGQKVFIEVVPDAESRRAALNIMRALDDAKWDVQKPIKFVDGLADGVSVQPSWANLHSFALYSHLSDTADQLLDFLHSFNWEAARNIPTDPQGNVILDETILPAGAIRIQVGLYPPAVYVTPPGQEAFIPVMEEIKRDLEKRAAESKRRREEELATYPPAVRQQIEQADEEMQAKDKKAMSNGPCQVLNPLW